MKAMRQVQKDAIEFLHGKRSDLQRRSAGAVRHPR